MDFTIKGQVTLEKYRNGDPVPYEVVTAPNALTTAGRQHLIDRIIGTASGNPLSQTSPLIIKSALGLTTRTLAQAENTYPRVTMSGGQGTATLTLRWVDAQQVTYEAHTLEVWFSGQTIQLNTLSPNFGTKLANETWAFNFSLTMVASSGLQIDGLYALLETVAGTRSSGLFAANKTYISIYSTYPTTQLNGALAASTVTRTGNEVTFTFISPSNLHNGNWAWIDLWSGPNATTQDVTLRSASSSVGVKLAGNQRQYQLRITFA